MNLIKNKEGLFSMIFEIIEFRTEYFDGLLKILKSVYETSISYDLFVEHYVGYNKKVFLAIFDDEVVGCSFVSILEDFVRPSKKAFVEYVAVDSSFRRCGVASSLFCSIEKYAKENSCSAIELTSANYRIGAHSFYQAIGFAKKETTLFIKEI